MLFATEKGSRVLSGLFTRAFAASLMSTALSLTAVAQPSPGRLETGFTVHWPEWGVSPTMHR